MGWREEAKKRAAKEAVKHVKDGDVVGLGTGSTAAYAIEEIGERISRERLSLLGIPTSNRTKALAVECGIPITTLEERPSPDIAIDGADQVDPRLNLIKGMGAALTREKVVDTAAKTLIIVVDETKLTDGLGSNQAVPIEVLPFALGYVVKELKKMGGKPHLRSLGGKTLVTDNGNVIVDVDFGPIPDPERLETEIKLIPGVIENGLFVRVVDVVYVGCREGLKKLERDIDC
ncbi:MAG: ribose-5-phosphate isomerase RpiA [Candidatus Bathyarchaeia archaeon]